MSDWATYIGIPFKEHGRTRAGLDCWGCVVLCYRERYGIDLPTYDDAYAFTSWETIASLVLLEQDAWRRVGEFDRTEGDVAVFRLRGLPVHVGVMIDADRFVHVTKGCNSVIERLSSPHWNRRFLAAYRHASRV